MEEREDVIIPKIIHFIWVGRKPLPEDNIGVILEWQKQNGNFEINIWVDTKISEKDTFEELEKHYKDRFFEHYQENFIQEPFELNIKIKDIRNEKIIDEFSQYEIEKARPNYGAASDILRYRILYELGGFYFDSDVKPPIISKNKFLILCNLKGYKEFDSLKNHVLYIEHLTQLPNDQIIPNQLLFNGEFESKNKRLGIDSLICSQKNPLMKKLYDGVLKNYDIEALNNKLKKDPINQDISCILAYGANNKRFTILRTGSEHLKFVLSSYEQLPCDGKNDVLLKVDDKFIVVKPVRCEEYCLTAPLEENTLSWLKITVHLRDSLKEAIEETVKIIQFELKYFNVLRLEDHIDDISRGLINASISKEVIANELINSITPIVKEHKDGEKGDFFVAQYLFENPLVKAFYDSIGINNRDILHKSDLAIVKINVIVNACGLEIINEVKRAIDNNQLEKEYTTIQKLEVIYCIKRGINFINQLSNRNNKFFKLGSHKDREREELLLDTCLDVLNKYKEIYKEFRKGNIIDSLKEACSLEDIEKIDNLSKIISDKLLYLKSPGFNI